MNYQETLNYLFTRLPMFSRIGAAAYKKDLENTIRLCTALDDPQHKFKSIHLAGTNGKGSTSHMLAAVLQKAGYKTGLCTSPHLYDFRERIRINGEMIRQEFVVDFTQRITPQIDLLDPSFFEITVAMAYDYFAQEKVDIAVIETGLGGRLDSTNVILPEVSVITNIGFDHMNLLGDTLEKIAAEKAGIIKPKVPAVIGEMHPVTTPVFTHVAATLQAPLIFADALRFIADWNIEHHLLSAEVTTTHDNSKESFTLDLSGIYQLKNLVTVLSALDQLRLKGWIIPATSIHSALREVKKLTGLHGRWETIQEHPAIVLDVCHNEDGIQQLIKQIEVTDHEELHIVIGLVKDKEIEKIINLLPKNATYYFTRAQIPRALPEDVLAEKAHLSGLTGSHYPTVNTALAAAKHLAGKRDLIVVCGSVFVVGEVQY